MAKRSARPLPSPFFPPGSAAEEFSKYWMIPVYLLDYIWVITIFFSTAFWLAVLIDGYILPPFDLKTAEATSTWVLYGEVLLQIALQGFLVITIAAFLQIVPSPVSGVMGYDTHGTLGSVIIRNSAIVTFLLLTLSHGLQGRLQILFARFNTNAGAAAVATSLVVDQNWKGREKEEEEEDDD